MRSEPTAAARSGPVRAAPVALAAMSDPLAVAGRWTPVQNRAGHRDQGRQPTDPAPRRPTSVFIRLSPERKHRFVAATVCVAAAGCRCKFAAVSCDCKLRQLQQPVLLLCKRRGRPDLFTFVERGFPEVCRVAEVRAASKRRLRCLVWNACFNRFKHEDFLGRFSRLHRRVEVVEGGGKRYF